MTQVYIEAAGLVAPGLAGWKDSLATLRADADYQAVELERYKPLLLPPNERRRATELTRLAFRVAEDVVNNTPASDISQLAAVFSSSCGDHQIIDQISRALCQEQRMVSPTQFHNSVHNSAAGYWSIATGSQATSTSLSAGDRSFCMSLLEATVSTAIEQQDTLLCSYDTQPPTPLSSKCYVGMPFASALILTPVKTANSLAQCSVELVENQTESSCTNPQIEALRTLNPAARCLPLLELLANNNSGSVYLKSTGSLCLKVSIATCQ